MSFFNELKRRNVLRVAAGYIVVAWLSVQVVETIFPAFGFGDEAIRFVVVTFAVGFIPVVVLAWVFEWTPEGIRKDEGTEQRGPVVAAASRRWDRIVMVILAIAVAYFIVEKVLEGADAEPTVAVLPFEVLSSDPEQQYLAAGIAEEVRGMLAGIPELKVTWHRSSFSGELQGLRIAEVGKQLGVAHVVIGSFRKVGNEIRVSSQLVDTRDEGVMWAQSFERELDDIFDIQEEIATSIVEHLQVEILGPIPRGTSTDPEIIILMAQVRQIFYDKYGGLPSKGTAERMWILLERVLEIDAEYVPAVSWLGYADWFAIREGLLTQQEARDRFGDQMERVLALDAEEPMMLQSMAWTVLDESGDLVEAADLYQRALRSGPNHPEVLRMVGKFAYLILQFGESRAILERAVQIDPLCTSCLRDLSVVYMLSGDLARAESIRERYLALGGRGGRYHLGLVKLMQGDAEQAQTVFDGFGEERYERFSGLAMVFHSLGRPEESDEMLNVLADRFGATQPGTLAEVEAWRGNADAAFGWLDQMIESPQTARGSFGGVKNYVGQPVFRVLHDDPRWAEFRERVGMSPEHLAALDVDLTIPE